MTYSSGCCPKAGRTPDRRRPASSTAAPITSRHVSTQLSPRPRPAARAVVRMTGANDERSERVAQPPIRPQLGKAGPRLHAGAHSVATPMVALIAVLMTAATTMNATASRSAAERRIKGGQSPKDPRSGERFERIAGCDPGGGPRRGLRASIRDERGEPDRRPERRAPQEQRREAIPVGRPDRGDLLGDKCKPEPQSCGEHVGHGDSQADARQAAKIGVWC